MHPTQRYERVAMRIKHLILWRSTFYVADFLRQRPMSSFKELVKVYQLFCNLCYLKCGCATRGIGLRANVALTPWLKRGGCGNDLLKFFTAEHLPAELRVISEPIGQLAWEMAERLPQNAELTTGLRKLLEAKDCFVRARLP
jgi:hypothetical protein